MRTQPKALRLADMIERYNAGVHPQVICEDYLQAAAELRRLHDVNNGLVEALMAFDAAAKDSKSIIGFAGKALPLVQKARAAIDRHGSIADANGTNQENVR